MKAQFDHNLMSSFYLWVDNQLVETAEAIISGETQVFKYQSGANAPTGFNVFYSSANQLYPDDCCGIFQESVYSGGTGNHTASPRSPSQYRAVTGILNSGVEIESGIYYQFTVNVTGWDNHPGINVYYNSGLLGTFGDTAGEFNFRFTGTIDGSAPITFNYYTTPFTYGTMEYENVVINKQEDINYVLTTSGARIYQGNGVYIDNNKARVLLPKSYGTEIPLSGNFIQKEINIYTTNESEEEIIIRNEFFLQSGQSYSDSMNQLAKAKYYMPCIFLSYNDSNNKGFALGGLRDTTTKVRGIVFARTTYQLEAILSTFRDSSEKMFKIIDFEDFPYGEYWHIKSYPYAYADYVENHAIDEAFIKKVSVYKLKDSGQTALQKIRKDLFLGYIDFEISTIRTT